MDSSNKEMTWLEKYSDSDWGKLFIILFGVPYRLPVVGHTLSQELEVHLVLSSIDQLLH